MHHQDLGVVAALRRRRMDVQSAEVAAERLVLLERQRLVAKEQHQVRHQRQLKRLDDLGRQWRGQVDTRDLGADDGRDGVDLNR